MILSLACPPWRPSLPGPAGVSLVQAVSYTTPWDTIVIPAKERVKKSKLQASRRLRSVIPAKAGIHLSSWNKL